MIKLFKQGVSTAFIASFAINSFAVEREPHQINDLRYGEALYNLYQEKYFTSITNLMVAKHRNPITNQNVDPELLLGGLYLYYGLHQNASNIFSGLIENNTSQETQDRAWFNIGKMRYQGQLYSEANKALIKVQDSLSAEREAERQNMLANTYLKQKDYSAAYESINQLNAHQDWKVYAQYNLGISLIKSGQNREGTDLLNQISSLNTNDNEWEIGKGLDYARDEMAQVMSYKTTSWGYCWYSLQLFGDPAMKLKFNSSEQIQLNEGHNYLTYQGMDTTLKNIAMELHIIEDEYVGVLDNGWHYWIGNFSTDVFNYNVYNGNYIDIYLQTARLW